MTKNEALQMCLEYIETDAHERKYVRHAIKDALGQPEQEPVAWRDPTNIDPGQGCTYKKEWREKWPHIYRQALYTTPPAAQRPWQGLTDEEIWSADPRIGTSDSNVNPYQILINARTIEAMLKEKNYG